MNNIRKNFMRTYHNLIHTKKNMDREFKLNSNNQDQEKRDREYMILCSKIDLLKPLLFEKR